MSAQSAPRHERPRAFDARGSQARAYWILKWDEFDWAEKQWIVTFVLFAREQTAREVERSFQGRTIRHLELQPLIDEVPAGREMVQCTEPPHIRFRDHVAGYRFANSPFSGQPRKPVRRARLRAVPNRND